MMQRDVARAASKGTIMTGMSRVKLSAAVLMVSVTVTVAAAQSPPTIDTSGWTVYRNAAMGFEVRHPPAWRVTPATGTGPEMVILGEPSRGERRQAPIQFWVQRDMNPRSLTIEQWYADQLTKIKTLPGRTTNTVIGGRPAILMENTGSFGEHFSFFTTINKIDILTVTVGQPPSRKQLDRIHDVILSTIKFIE